MIRIFRDIEFADSVGGVETVESAINTLIKVSKADTNKISDGYHTFGELYQHRIEIYIALCKKEHYQNNSVWRSRLHSDGSEMDGWFVLGINTENGKQITYHLPSVYWIDTLFAITLDKAPEFDGHTSAQVLERISLL